VCRVDHPRPRRRAPAAAAARPRCPGPRRARRHAGGALSSDGIRNKCMFMLS